MLTELVGVARANGIASTDLQASADRSVRGLLAALPAPGKADGDLDNALLAATRQAIEDISRSTDTTKKTAESVVSLKAIADRLEAGRASWADWARLSKLESAKAADRFLEPVRAAAAQHQQHPKLQEDIERFIRTMFTAAAESMASVQQYKRAQGLVDFVDQEADALDLLADDAAARRIAARTKLLLVDEFQDTSPIQLALFLRLAGLVEQTLFVGDTKQAIYGFRGADPDLVDAVSRSHENARATAHRCQRPSRRRQLYTDKIVPVLAIKRDAGVIDEHASAGRCHGQIAPPVVQRCGRRPARRHQYGRAPVQHDGATGCDVLSQ